MNNKPLVLSVVGWLFGIIFLAIGGINMFWGNDPFFGIFIFLLAFVYFPPVNILVKKMTGFSIHPVIKVLLGIFFSGRRWASANCSTR